MCNHPDVARIVDGDTSPILCTRPISEFLTSSGTSAGKQKLMPTIEEELDGRPLLYSLLVPVMSQYVPNLEKGKGIYLLFIKSKSKTPDSLPACPELTSYYKSSHFKNREALRVGAVFAPGFIRTIKFLENHWTLLCNDITTRTLNEEITNPVVREAVAKILRPDPNLADFIAAECGKDSWHGIITRLWPNTKYVDVVFVGTMSQYIPTLDFYNNGLPLVCTMYASSECYFRKHQWSYPHRERAAGIGGPRRC
ncbi:hypothetical protein MLD38_025591 [Melastoma candidum]|uniref:Uncharacterized protein n=1 Tax=Melastoma candidum TaxID=119954 RepID=A0ACB9NWS8_9MYRT|nr:hypothetical protein MLD38_025591 [Melastoma candidum]